MKGKALATGALVVGTAGVALGGLTQPAQASPAHTQQAQASSAHASSVYRYGDSGWAANDKGGRWAYAGIKPTKSSGKFVVVRFEPRGEHLSVYDYWKDGKGVTAYLHVAGSGTATFKARNGKPYNLSFSENKKVTVKICINGGPCSDKWHAIT